MWPQVPSGSREQQAWACPWRGQRCEGADTPAKSQTPRTRVLRLSLPATLPTPGHSGRKAAGRRSPYSLPSGLRSPPTKSWSPDWASGQSPLCNPLQCLLAEARQWFKTTVCSGIGHYETQGDRCDINSNPCVFFIIKHVISA